jgi:3'(2'), 5'-bisphosphate nucleotidase
MRWDKEKQVAVQAVLEAGKVCRQVQAALVSEDTLIKKDRSPVTVADFASQAIIIHAIKQTFPHDPIVGEESAAELRTAEAAALRKQVVHYAQSIHTGLTEEEVLSAIDAGNHSGGTNSRFWTLDPIDGTKGFLRKEQYAVALALIENGEVVLGVLGCPNLPFPNLGNPESNGTLFIAVKGHGAVMRARDGGEDQPIHTAPLAQLRDAIFCESVESGHSSHSDSQKIADLLGIHTEPVRIDSQCKYAVVARGEASIYLRLPTSETYREKIWDHAAGYLVTREAGGEVTDIHGTSLDFSQGRKLTNNRGVVATQGAFHSEVIQTVKQVLEIG